MSRCTAHRVFVTGTDTGVGKTLITGGLLRAARRAGVDACGFKPVASGASQTRDGLRNEDALSLMASSANDEPYDAINPYVFAPPVAPHLAAKMAGERIQVSRLNRALAELASRHEWVLIEGAGGWRVPLDAKRDFSDWVCDQNIPVVLVVAMRLGCINHALLSAESIVQKTRLLGWIANEVPPRQALCEENLATLKKRMPAPLLGRVKARQRDLGHIWNALERLQLG